MTSSIFLLFLSLIVASAEQEKITAESGQNVTLQSRAPTNSDSILAVQWSRADLEPDYVLLYRDDQFVPDNQHPSFKNRVDLQDRQMKDGDVTLVLKDVTVNDTGTYKCRVFRRRAVQSITSIYLSVVPPGPIGGLREDGGKQDEDSRGHFGLVSVVVVTIVVVTAIVIFKKQNTPLPPRPAEAAEMSADVGRS